MNHTIIRSQQRENLLMLLYAHTHTTTWYVLPSNQTWHIDIAMYMYHGLQGPWIAGCPHRTTTTQWRWNHGGNGGWLPSETSQTLQTKQDTDSKKNGQRKGILKVWELIAQGQIDDIWCWCKAFNATRADSLQLKKYRTKDISILRMILTFAMRLLWSYNKQWEGP